MVYLYGHEVRALGCPTTCKVCGYRDYIYVKQEQDGAFAIRCSHCGGEDKKKFPLGTTLSEVLNFFPEFCRE